MEILLAAYNPAIKCWPDLLHQDPNLRVKERIFREALMTDCLAIASPSCLVSEGRSSKLEVLPRDDFA